MTTRRLWADHCHDTCDDADEREQDMQRHYRQEDRRIRRNYDAGDGGHILIGIRAALSTALQSHLHAVSFLHRTL